jgi:hypothetical protein
MSGTSALQSSRCSRKSRRAESAQWRSSNHENRRAACGERLEIATPGRERLLSGHPGDLVLHSDERREAIDDPGAVRLVDDLGHSADLLESRARRVRLEHAGLGLDDLSERPERDPVAVGQAAPLAPAHDVRATVDLLAELPDETALSHARFGDHRDKLRRRLTQGTENVSTRSASSDPRPTNRSRHAGSVSTPKRLRAFTARHTAIGSFFPFAATGSSGSNSMALPTDRVCRHVDDHSTDRCRRLQACRRVHDIPGDDSLSPLRSCAEGHDRLARRHCRSNGDVEALVPESLDRLEDPERGANGPLGIVLVARQGHRTPPSLRPR